MANEIKVYRADRSSAEVWLSTGIMEYDGICLSAEDTTEKAIEAAIRDLLQHTETLRMLLYRQVDAPRVKALR